MLRDIAKTLVVSNKGILAADESTKTIEKRLSSVGVESTEANRLAYRHILFTAPEIEKYLSGVILYDETIRQKIDGVEVPNYLQERGIIPGIKVDKGAWRFPGFDGEKITEGLDGLRDRLSEYKTLGAKFAKWRAVITIGENLPSDACLLANANALALYAAFCQEQEIVPIVEPEVLMDGGHDLKRCQEVTKQVLKMVFDQLKLYKVELGGILLKPNMVISGKESSVQTSSQEVAQATIETFKEVVPEEVSGIVFLSGGQTPNQATQNLAAINAIGGSWQLSFSFGRALQDEALKVWAGKEENVKKAQEVFLERAEKVSKARF